MTVCERCGQGVAEYLVHDHADAETQPSRACARCAEDARRLGLRVESLKMPLSSEARWELVRKQQERQK